MKIEANKSKLSLNKNQAVRQGKNPPREPGTEVEEVSVEVPKKKSKPAKIKEPKVKAPSIKAPKIKAPKIKIPRIKLPGIKLPTLKVSKPSFKKSGTPRAKGKRSLRVAAVLGAVPVLLIAVWLGMNLVKHSAPPPLFTENNLPPVPPADTNGCSVIYDNQVYNEFFAKDICDINLFSNASAMELFLDKARGEYTVAKTLAARDDVKKMMGLYRDIIKKPVFADMAKPDPADGQKYRVYLALHNSITATMIVRMQEKRYGEAFRLMRDQMSLNIQYIRSARSMTNYLTAMRAYEKSLNILKSMMNQFTGDRRMGGDVVAASREIAELIKTLNQQGVSLSQIVMFEYILSWKQNFNPAVRHPEAGVLQGMKRKALVFFDRGLTQKLFNERWKQLYEYARRPGDATPEEVRKLQEQRYTTARFWWLHNAVGKKYLDSIPIPVYNLFQESKNWSTAINQKQAEIVSMVSGLKETARLEKKPAQKAVKRQAGKPGKKK
jgi:hypothetical protein